MSHPTVRLTAAAVAAFALLTACSGGTGGNAEPSATAGSSAPSDSAGAGPKVPAPLPTKDLLNDPCTALDAAGADQVGAVYPGVKVVENLTACRFTSASSRQNTVHITPVPQNKNGISDIYAQKAKQAYFTPTTVDGYPAVYASVEDARSSGSCTLWVGVTDQLAVSVLPQIGSGTSRDGCGVAQKFADAMIKHLKGAS